MIFSFQSLALSRIVFDTAIDYKTHMLMLYSSFQFLFFTLLPMTGFLFLLNGCTKVSLSSSALSIFSLVERFCCSQCKKKTLNKKDLFVKRTFYNPKAWTTFRKVLLSTGPNPNISWEAFQTFEQHCMLALAGRKVRQQYMNESLGWAIFQFSFIGLN